MVSVLSSPAYRNRVWFAMAVVAAAGLGLAACGTAANVPEEHLTREAAADLAASRLVDEQLVSSIRVLGEPRALTLVAASEASPGADAPDLAGCLPALEGADGDADGYPAVWETLSIDCDVFFHLGGTLRLWDEDDQDPLSGFRSELDFRITLTAGDETHLFTSGTQTVRVAAREGGGYALSYGSTIHVPAMAEEEPFLAFESRLTYAGTLAGSFEAGTLAIEEGTVSLVPVPVDCSKLAGDEQQACRAQAPEHAGPAPAYAVSSTGIVFDKAACDTVLTGGYFKVSDDPGNVLTVSYAECGKRSAAYNGEMLPLPPPPPQE
ncbi:MAG: hypothetical protein OXH96_10375 [Spirochaetaceae bacterium]|nr:hypothetical protein [Spirochaetaceae bacterium]